MVKTSPFACSALFHFNKTEKSFSPICWAIFRNITEFSRKLSPLLLLKLSIQLSKNGP